MANLQRARWLGLALVPCSGLVLLLGATGGRGPGRPRSGADWPEREHAEVRGRPVSSVWDACTSDESETGPRRPATGTRRCELRPAETGAGASLAALTGRITRDGRGVPARIRFELGWNEGLDIDTSRDGAFSHRSLGPGFQQVKVVVEGRPPCTRSLFLAPYREATLQLDFGAPSTRSLRVLDPEGRPLPDAVVELDGATTTTDAAGRARVVAVASGAPELVVRAPGCAWFACALEADARNLPGDELVVRLDPACALELHLPALASAHEAVVYLLPREPGRLAGRPLRPATPWHLASPLRLASGASVRLENLPAGELEIRALHPAARLAIERVLLDPARPLALTLRATAIEPDEHPALGSLGGLLSSAGLGGLPRLQPLDPTTSEGRSSTHGSTWPAPGGAGQ